jgi:hypothetical protein
MIRAQRVEGGGYWALTSDGREFFLSAEQIGTLVQIPEIGLASWRSQSQVARIQQAIAAGLGLTADLVTVTLAGGRLINVEIGYGHG